MEVLTPMPRRNQSYAIKAHNHVEEFSKENKENKEAKSKYKSMCEKLPILIRTSGLAQALAFVEAKKEKAWERLLDHLEETLESQVTVIDTRMRQTLSSRKIVENSRTLPLNEYMQLTRDVLSALLWYKRFSQSLLIIDKDKDKDESETKKSLEET